MVNLGYLASVQAGFLSPALAAFQTRPRAIRLNLYELTPAGQIAALRSGKLDVALVGHHDPANLRDLRITILRTIPLQAIVSSQHPLASRAKIKLGDLAGETLVGYNEELFPGRNELITRACLKAGFQPRLRPCAESLSAVLAFVGAGEGVCVIPADVAKMAHPHVTFLPLRRPVPTVQFAALTRREVTSPTLSELLACLRDAAQDLSSPTARSP